MSSFNNRIAVFIPSYDRPEILKFTLPGWLKASCVGKVFIVAEASSRDRLERYRGFIETQRSDKLVYKLALKKMGSVKARNVLLDLFAEDTCEYAVMADDDYLLLDEGCLIRMARTLESGNEIGAVGGKVIVIGRRGDPDFFLNLPLNLSDLLTRLTGYVFLDIQHGPRYSEFLPPFFMLRKEVLSKMVKYDEIFDTPTGFREESDFQLQIKNLGYKLLYDPRVYVVHLAAGEGGNRPKMNMEERIYWKARNHTIFILKWNKPILKRVWYIMLSALILSLYRIWHTLWIFRGVKDGIRDSIKIKYGLGL
ncbi:glycosyltransferase family 2 protein [Candidatus Bathyarchaeota archaeon]|nr:glycosyltransferase family 2 protein [Candidatus Bathyarchaeota archaeon]